MKVANILNESEKLKVGKFLEDETLVNAVKKILLLGIYNNGTINPGDEYDATTNFALHLAFQKDKSPEQIGQDLKACAEGIRLLEGGFKQLEDNFKIKPIVEQKQEINKAR